MSDRRIIDCHHHVSEDPDHADRLAEECAKLGIAKVIALGFQESRRPGANARVLAAAAKQTDLILPFAGVDLENDTPETVAEYKAEGFRGLKFIGPPRAYNDPDYLPLYRAACEQHMVGLFHLGIIANGPAWSDMDSNRMRPIYLDHIARQIPEWKMIGAHLGNPWYEEATMSCRWNPNLFFDLSGSTLKKKSPEFLGGLLWWGPDTFYKGPDKTYAWQKIVFGSDVAIESIHDVVNDYERVMDGLDLPEERRQDIWYGTAARVLGLED